MKKVTGWLSITALLLITLPASLAAQGAVPTPESVLGFKPGADFHIFTYEAGIDYLRQVENATDRLELVEVGRTTNGRAMYIALISSAENLRNVERYRDISMRLAHPEGLSDGEARRLAQEGKAIVHIDGGMHSSEVADHQHTIQLAYDLVTGDDDPEIAAILENVIFILWPTLNPEGQTMVAEWYMSNVGTRYEVSSPPELYQEYVGHDNNRDGYMLNMVESRVITRVLREWEPQILYNHHQTAPFPTRIWIPPFAEPVSPHVHPLMWRTVNLMGMSMSQALEERGQRGATHMGTGFDDWYPGFMDHANSFHNIASFLTETGLYRYATPHFYTVNDFPEDKRDLRPESLYPSPWQGGWWRLGDATAYMNTASVSVLDFAAKYRFDVLYNRYQAGRDIIAHYSENPPYAYLVPQEQRDPVAPVELLRRLAFNGIEVDQFTRTVSYDGFNYPAGTWVIRMDQPFANFVRQLFDIQEYPDLRQYEGGPMDQPYDVAGWTLPMQMDVRVVAAETPLTEDFRSALEPVQGAAVAWDAPDNNGSTFDSPPDVGFDADAVAAGIVPRPVDVTGRGAGGYLDPAQNNVFKVLNATWNHGGDVRYVPGRNRQSSGQQRDVSDRRSV
ncbi:M14 family zinc carboxypeptidase [Gemmatimonadota bacterium]